MRWLQLSVGFLLMIVTTVEAKAQILTPVKWETSYAAGDNPGEYTLIFSAKIDEGWKVYGNDIPPGGAIPTGIFFDDTSQIELGAIELLGRKHGPKYEKYFDMELTWFTDRVVVRQPITVTSAKAEVSGYLEYMTCDATRCLPPSEVKFSYTLSGNGTGSAQEETPTQETGETAGDGEEAGPSITFSTPEEQDKPSGQAEEETTTPTEPAKESKSLWGYLLAGLGAGFLALLTPCVFPMIPLTVSFFTKSSSSRSKGLMNALTYAFSIILIFLGLGFFITMAFGPDALNAMASNNIFNLAFFVIFIIFALSFFGVFELTLPNSLVNKADAMSDRGGFIGIFFMAFTLVLVSFSCTMPLIGSLLVIIAESSAFWAPLMGLLGFALALAIPFALFAAFPGWLNSLPKSGGWLNTVKVTLGFIEVALAFKFLSVADLAYHWNFLTRDIFIAIWVIVAILLGMYLLGKLRFPGEAPSSHTSVPRLFLAILSFAFAIYLLPGMWGAPVKLLSGIAPPQHYQEFSLNSIQYKLKQLENQVAALQENTPKTSQEQYANLIPEDIVNVGHCPHELACEFDLQRGLIEAKRTNKPILLDFTGWACVNCRKMEDYVWSDPAIWDLINEKFVLVSLYVDDKTPLPEAFQTSPYTGNEVRTVGKMWSDYQTTQYKANAQPYYVLLDHELEKLVPAKGYTPDVEAYKAFLESGLDAFHSQELVQR